MRMHRRLAVGAGVSVALLAGATIALASQARPGGIYSGTLKDRSDITVSFHVTLNGKTVNQIQISNVPIYCSAGGPPIIVHFKSVAISKKGTFTTTGAYKLTAGPKKGQVGARLQLTGTFKRGGKETGTVKTTYPAARSCNGTSSYATKIVGVTPPPVS